MSERARFEAGKEARRGVLHDVGREQASGEHMEALLRYVKGAKQGQSTGAGRAKELSDEQAHAQVVDRVVATGGEVSTAIVVAGSVWLRGRVRRRSEIAQLERDLARIPGIIRLDMRMHYDTDDTQQSHGQADDDQR
jgi:hypothetical protein